MWAETLKMHWKSCWAQATEDCAGWPQPGSSSHLMVTTITINTLWGEKSGSSGNQSLSTETFAKTVAEAWFAGQGRRSCGSCWKLRACRFSTWRCTSAPSPTIARTTPCTVAGSKPKRCVQPPLQASFPQQKSPKKPQRLPA